jgi:hypothetical protein
MVDEIKIFIFKALFILIFAKEILLATSIIKVEF